MKHYIIFCAGRNEEPGYPVQRWDEKTNPYRDIPKQLLEIDGEPILHRTVRLIKKFDEESRIYIIAKKEIFKTDGAELFLVPEKDISPWLYDRVLQVQPVFSPDSGTVFLYGDVWYSDEAMYTICRYSGDFQWFGRIGPSEISGQNHGEDYGFYISKNKINIFLEKIHKIKNTHHVKNISKDWMHFIFMYFEMNNMKYDFNTYSADKKNCPNWINIDDFTNDVDLPHEFNEWKKRYDLSKNKFKLTKENILGIRTENLLKPLDELIDFISSSSDINIKNMEMVEIGSYIGESTCVFLKRVGIVHSVDTFKWIQHPNTSWSMTKENPSPAEIEFDRKTSKYSNLKKFKGTSEEYAKTLLDESLDFIYIDALHEYEAVKKDIELWYPKVKKGGFICGHDYTDTPSYFGVIPAVNEKFGKPDRIFSDTSWVVKKV